MTQDFYDALASFYHLHYADWGASMARQCRGAAAALTEFGVGPGSAVLDAACGIGTQSLGLADLGYRVTASDISAGAVARARAEADSRGLSIAFAVADLRHLSEAFSEPFAAVIALDNAIPHLLSDGEIRAAFVECRKVLRPGGVLLISVRDYAAMDRRTPAVHSYGTRTIGDCRYSAEQVWRWDGDQYDLTLKVTEQQGDEPPVIHEFRSRYYAVDLQTLQRLMQEADFERVTRRDDHFFQPLLVGVKAPRADER